MTEQRAQAGRMRRRHGNPLAMLALAGLLAFAVTAVVVQVLRDDLDWINAPLSFYLLGTCGHWLQAAYFALAIALYSLGAGYYRALCAEHRSAAPWCLFGFSGMALCVTALAHSNLPGQAQTLEGWVHGTAAQAAFLCVSVAMLLQSWWLRANASWRRHFPLAFALSLAGFVAIWVDALWHGMPRGLEQRLVIALLWCWLLLASCWLWRRPGDSD